MINFTPNNIIKLFIDSIGQDAFADFYDFNWPARKKEIQKLIKLDYDFDIVHDKNFKRFVDILNEFVDWAKEKDYINTWDKGAILDLLIPYMHAVLFTPQGVIPEKEFIEYTIMYSICNAYKRSVQEVLKSKSRPEAVTAAIYQFNFYLTSNDYTENIEPLEGVFDLFLALAKDKKKLYEYWNDRRYELDEKDSTDLKILINRWTKSETSRPSWKVIKLFMNEDLLPEEDLIYQPFPDINGKVHYLTFRRKIFSAYFITNLFDSLCKQGFINDTSKEMIKTGIRLFYRHFIVTKEQYCSQEELNNPMFVMLYRFLLRDDMGYDFNTDTAQYFKRYIF